MVPMRAPPASSRPWMLHPFSILHCVHPDSPKNDTCTPRRARLDPISLLISCHDGWQKDCETLGPTWEFTCNHGSTSILDAVLDCDVAREVLQMDVNFRFSVQVRMQSRTWCRQPWGKTTLVQPSLLVQQSSICLLKFFVRFNLSSWFLDRKGGILQGTYHFSIAMATPPAPPSISSIRLGYSLQPSTTPWRPLDRASRRLPSVPTS